MKLLPSDPDVETIIARIRAEDLDLQPDFQRGEVWTDSKKRRLIDTILRDWHIPPIHVIERPDSHKQEVLDGQQRLAAIRDFVNGLIRVDGKIEPIDEEIREADGVTYETLPAKLRRRFDRFTIRVFRLVDFNPDEPGELFFRLNQPTSLTAAEQRNAFFGPVRAQVRKLCESFPDLGISEDFLGFSNSRMAYDDIVAKLCLALERGTISERITAATITDRYRHPEPLRQDVIERANSALGLLGSTAHRIGNRVKFNKATLFSWLCFATRVCRYRASSSNAFSDFLLLFELARQQVVKADSRESTESNEKFPLFLLSLFTDRASLRVSDVTSVLLRDAILAYSFVAYEVVFLDGAQNEESALSVPFRSWSPLLHQGQHLDEFTLLNRLQQSGWGKLP
ncbi:MAG: DUF262 domain-containing protein [Candidatus Hydrogenedentes bacterium]|nr:DUF262 domain-containing protein [Candidatus Hydrogenedentota bacterium]